jgi:hypothetical protein
MSDDSDVTLDPDQASDITIGPSDEETNDAETSATKPVVCSPPKEPIQKRKSLPYKFKKIKSSVHSISDSDSEEEPQQKSVLLSKIKPTLSQKQSSSSNKSLRVISDRGSGGEPQRKTELKKSPSNPKPTLSPRETVSKSLHLISDNDSDSDEDDKQKTASEKSTPAVSPKKRHSGDKSKDSLAAVRHIPKDNSNNSASGRKPPSTTKQDGASKRKSPSPKPGPCPKPGPSKRSRDEDDDESSSEWNDSRPVCPYGDKCYRNNPAHRKDFRHLGQYCTFI